MPMTTGRALPSFLLLAVAVLLGAPSRLGATSVVLGSDADLADQAPVVLEATVLALLPAPLTPGLPATDYPLRVEPPLNGPAALAPTPPRASARPAPHPLPPTP